MLKGSECRYEKAMFCKRLCDFINAEFPDEGVKSIYYEMDIADEFVYIKYGAGTKRVNVTFDSHRAIMRAVNKAIFDGDGFEWVREV